MEFETATAHPTTDDSLLTHYWIDNPHAYVEIIETPAGEQLYCVETVDDQAVAPDSLADASPRNRSLDVDAFGPVTPLLKDPHIEDISYTGDQVFVYHQDYKNLQTNLALTTQEFRQFGMALLSAEERVSVIDGRTNYFSPRLNAHITFATDPPSFTLHFPSSSVSPYRLASIYETSYADLARVWSQLQNDGVVLVAGTTGTAKELFADSLARFLPATETRVFDARPHNLIPQTKQIDHLTDAPDDALVYAASADDQGLDMISDVLERGGPAVIELHADSAGAALRRLKAQPFALENVTSKIAAIVELSRRLESKTISASVRLYRETVNHARIDQNAIALEALADVEPADHIVQKAYAACDGGVPLSKGNLRRLDSP